MLSTLTTVVALTIAGSASAAAPHTVAQRGTPATTAVPGKPFTMNFHVKNTGGDGYNAVNVIFHIPDGLTHSKVSPTGATIQDDIVSWNNIPMAAGQSLYPSFTFTMDAGTPLKTKLNLWVEVTGDGFDATSKNFSITAVSKVKPPTTTSALTSADISAMFQQVYGRTPTSSELTYWLGRRSDKPSHGPLLGAMHYHRARNIAH